MEIWIYVTPIGTDWGTTYGSSAVWATEVISFRLTKLSATAEQLVAFWCKLHVHVWVSRSRGLGLTSESSVQVGSVVSTFLRQQTAASVHSEAAEECVDDSRGGQIPSNQHGQPAEVLLQHWGDPAEDEVPRGNLNSFPVSRNRYIYVHLHRHRHLYIIAAFYCPCITFNGPVIAPWGIVKVFFLITITGPSFKYKHLSGKEAKNFLLETNFERRRYVPLCTAQTFVFKCETSCKHQVKVAPKFTIFITQLCSVKGQVVVFFFSKLEKSTDWKRSIAYLNNCGHSLLWLHSWIEGYPGNKSRSCSTATCRWAALPKCLRRL